MNEELGKKANRTLVKEVSDKIISSWRLEGKYPKNPFVLMLGGFQGSGKTTVLNILRNNVDFIIISPDQIRHELFSKNVKFSDKFVHSVNAIKNNLLKKALKTKRNIAIDQLINLDRINIVQQLMSIEKNYRLVKVLLSADENMLAKRVKDRANLPGIYKGTLSELKASIRKYGKPDISLYDKVLDTQKLKPHEAVKELLSLLQA